MRTYLFAVAGLAAALGCAGAAPADTNAMAPARVTFCGTVVKLVEDHCIGVKGSMVGAPLVEITSAVPKPAVGALIAGSGVPGGVSICMQGTHLTSVVWHKAAACPLKH